MKVHNLTDLAIYLMQDKESTTRLLASKTDPDIFLLGKAVARLSTINEIFAMLPNEIKIQAYSNIISSLDNKDKKPL